ncbi:MAG: M1 family aminopeptidase, partial [Gemmatimonadaceae bacterium]
GREGEMLRWSNFHYTSQAYFIASYQKPASVLATLRGLLGEETFNRALRSLFDRWSFRHPYPWDFFATFEAVSGRDLDWFWRAWYHETWTLDQAVGSVSETADGARIVVEDRGDVPMPARLTVTRADGRVERREIPVETWLGGARTASVTLPPGSPVQRVEIDAGREFPDIDRQNNVWPR